MSYETYKKYGNLFKHQTFVEKLVNCFYKEVLYVPKLGEVDIELYIHCLVKQHIMNLENDSSYIIIKINPSKKDRVEEIINHVFEVLKLINEKPKLKEYDKIISGGIDYLYKIRKTDLKDMRLLIDETI